MNDDMDSYLIAMDTSIAPGPSTSDSTSSKRQAVANHRTRLHSEEEEEAETAEKDGPPNKKVHFSFSIKTNAALRYEF